MRRSIIGLAAFVVVVVVAVTPGLAAFASARKPTASELAGIRAGVRAWWCGGGRHAGPCSSWTFIWGQALVSSVNHSWALTSYRARQQGRVPQEGLTAVLRRGTAAWKVVTSFTDLEGQPCAAASRQIHVPERIAKDLGICRDLPGP